MKIHFIGIGGIGMSALAEICIARGNAVSGSDLRPNNLTENLAGKGAKICRGHEALHLAEDVDLVIRTTCIRDDNPEIIRAKGLGKKIISRGELLKKVLEETPVSIGVTGTHGKTTTSALVSNIMEASGKEPTIIIGGERERSGGNAKQGKGGVLVAEVDESDGFFRNIGVTHAVITNAEREHMEHYGSFENLLDAYREFIGRVPPEGVLVYCGEDLVLSVLIRERKGRKIDYGIGGGYTVTCVNPSHAGSICFDLMIGGVVRARVESPLIGRHNVLNLLAAIAVSLEAGAGLDDCLEAARGFRGVRRRFDLVGEAGSIKVVEDYAHHPTELKAVIKAAKEHREGRIVAVFQPHRYSRTKDLAKEFSECFYGADALVLTDIYSADEDPIPGAGIMDILKMIDRKRFFALEYMKKGDIPSFVAGIAREGDTILILGAGDIREVAKPTLEAIRRKSKK